MKFITALIRFFFGAVLGALLMPFLLEWIIQCTREPHDRPTDCDPVDVAIVRKTQQRAQRADDLLEELLSDRSIDA